MEKGGRKMQGRQTVKIVGEMIDHNPHYLDLYGQEPCYYGESLVLTGESMSQLGDMRWSQRLEWQSVVVSLSHAHIAQ